MAATRIQWLVGPIFAKPPNSSRIRSITEKWKRRGWMKDYFCAIQTPVIDRWSRFVLWQRCVRYGTLPRDQRVGIAFDEYRRGSRRSCVDPLTEKNEGYPTPKVDVRALIQKDEKSLRWNSLTKEWSLPGGYAEIGLTPRENIKRSAGRNWLTRWGQGAASNFWYESKTFRKCFNTISWSCLWCFGRGLHQKQWPQ